MIKRILQQLLNAQQRWPWLFVVGALLLFFIAMNPSRDLLRSVSTSLLSLFAKDSPLVRDSLAIKERFHNTNPLFLVVTTPDAHLNLAAVQAIQKELSADDQIDRVETEKTAYDFFEQHKLLFFELQDLYAITDKLQQKIDKKKLQPLLLDFEDESESANDFLQAELKKYEDKIFSGFKSRYRSNPDETVFVVHVYPKNPDTSLKFYETFTQHVQDRLKFWQAQNPQYQNVQLGFAGHMVLQPLQKRVVFQDLQNAGLISFSCLFILFILYAMTQFSFVQNRVKRFSMRVCYFLLVILPMVVSTIYNFAINTIWIQELNLITSFLFAILFGMGVEVGIHLVSRYLEERQIGKSVAQALNIMVFQSGRTSFSAVLTTILGFYVLMISKFHAFVEFGILAGNGLIISFLVYLLIIPSCLVLLERWDAFDFQKGKSAALVLPSLDEKLQERTLGWHKMVRGFRWLFIVLFVMTVWGSQKIAFENDFGNLVFKDSAVEYWKAKVRETAYRFNAPAVYQVHTAVESRALMQALREQKSKGYPIEEFYSYFEMLSLEQVEKIAVLQKLATQINSIEKKFWDDKHAAQIADFLNDVKRLSPLTDEQIPTVLKMQFGVEAGLPSLAYAAAPAKWELAQGDKALAFYEALKDLQILQKTWLPSGEAIVFANILYTLSQDASATVALAILAIVFVCSWHFRNILHTSLVLASLLFGFCGMLCVMTILQIKLSFFNLVLMPVIIGMGEDNSVHLLERYKEQGFQNLRAVLRTSGKSALMASLTGIFGYFGLCFVEHPGLRAMGFTAVIGMLSCLFSSLVVLPFFMVVLKKRRS